MLRKSYKFWLQHINPHITTLIVTIGVVGLASCLSISFILAQLFQEVLEKEAFGFDSALLYWIHGYANPSLIPETSFSFPSGHALGGFVMYGFLAYLLSAHFPKFSKLIYTLAVFAIAIIGLSRMYIGVHWPTDIIAGYGVGYIWLMLCIIMLKLQTRQVQYYLAKIQRISSCFLTYYLAKKIWVFIKLIA